MKSNSTTEDIPRMFKAKVALSTTHSTSTPLKPIFSNVPINLEESTSALKSILGVSPVSSRPSTHANVSRPFRFPVKVDANKSPSSHGDSGFLSMSESNTTLTPKSSSSSNLSMFKSIMESRKNTSLSLEQVIEKVNSRKEKVVSKSCPRARRLRSYSASEVSVHQFFSKESPTLLEVSKMYDLTSSPDENKSDINESDGGSPTIEQAIMMGCKEEVGNQDCGFVGSCSPDYNLEELVKALRIKHGVLKPPPTPSPPTSYYKRTPQSLFGKEGQPTQPKPVKLSQRPKLPSTPEQEQETLAYSSTPEQYYMSGFEPISPLVPPATSSLQSVISPGSTTSSLPQDTNNQNRTSSVDADCTWSGTLPPRRHKNPVFSCKIFLGGVPWDVTESTLIQAFGYYGPIRIEWPGKDTSPSPPKGYVYIIFEDEKNVPLLLSQCTHDYANGGSWYYKISSRRMRSKEVQIIPWVLGDSNFVLCSNQRLDPQKTVFVGALHGMLNAEGLACIFNDLFGGVVYAGIDTDKHKYPIGSGRVTFSSSKSYMKAVAAAFIEIKCQKFSKKVQVDPYLEDSLCSCCLLKQGPYFCRDLVCFKYFCRHCWESSHNHGDNKNHKPLMRNNRSGGGPATRPIISITSPCTRE